MKSLRVEVPVRVIWGRLFYRCVRRGGRECMWLDRRGWSRNWGMKGWGGKVERYVCCVFEERVIQRGRGEGFNESDWLFTYRLTKSIWVLRVGSRGWCPHAVSRFLDYHTWSFDRCCSILVPDACKSSAFKSVPTSSTFEVLIHSSFLLSL